jgi:hypothetical protein
MDEDAAEYFEVVVVARSTKTDIWLAHEGHLVQKSYGTLETRIMPGHYTVEFGLGAPTYPLHVTQNLRLTEEELTSGLPCARPVAKFPPPESVS